MRNLGTLYKYELKKIFLRKIVWVCIAAMLILVTFGASERFLGDYYVNGEKISSEYERITKDIEYEKRLTGRKVDETLFRETVDAFKKIPGQPEDYAAQKEYQVYGRPYYPIYYYITKNAGLTDAEARVWIPDMADFEVRRLKGLEDSFDKYRLTAGERSFWLGEDAKVERPLTYSYAGGWQKLVSLSYSFCSFLTLALGVCLSAVFSQEHSLGTDQIALCGRYGRGRLYLAKILAGETFAAGFALLVTAAAFGALLGIYGADGFGAPIQLSRSVCPYNISVGQGALICYGLMTAAAMITGMLTMLLSELTRGGVASVGVITAITVVTLFFNVPERYRVIAQLWDYMPTCISAHWNAFSLATVPLFGRYFVAWQVAPVLYAVVGAAMGGVGCALHGRYQIGGR